MPTRTRKSPAKQQGRRPVFSELRAIREQIEQLETLHATLDAVGSKLLALVATFRPSLLKKGKSIRTLGPGRGVRRSLPRASGKQRRAARGSKEDAAMKVWIYIDASKQIDDPDHLKVFTSQAAADGWFEDHGPEGVVVEYPVSGHEGMIRPPEP
jgi:hypothetical protein